MAEIKLDILADLTPLNVGLSNTIDKLQSESKQLGNDMAGAFSKADSKAKNLDNTLSSTNSKVKNTYKTYQQAAGEVNKLITKEQALLEARNRSNNPKAIARFNDLIKENQKQLQKLTGLTNNQAQATGKLSKENASLSSGVGKMGSLIAGAFSIGALVSFAKKTIDIRAEFQRFEAVLTNTLGSKSLAQNALLQIQKFAAETPFSVQEVTASFVKLANQGFEPTIRQLDQLGDLAASQGKSFDQLTEAIIDAQTGEFERLKEFGIRGSKSGDQVTFSFKGVQTQTKFTNDEIRKYILSLGDLEGVTGGMNAISKTLGGQISNLGDNFDALFNNIGKATESGSGGLLSFLNEQLGQITATMSNLNNITFALNGTSGMLGTFESISDGLQAFQLRLNATTKNISEFTNQSDFVDVYRTLANDVKFLNDAYKEGSIDVFEYNRRVILLGKSVLSVDEQRKHLSEQTTKAAEISKQKSADQLKAEEIASAKRKKLLEDYGKAQEDLRKRVEAAQTSSLTGAEKINLESQFNQEEIDLLQKHFIEIGKLTNSNYKLTLDQEEQFGILRNSIREKQLTDLIKVSVDKQNELAQAMAASANSKGVNLGLEETNAVNAASLVSNPGLSPEAFEASKQQTIFKIQQDYALKKLKLSQDSLAAEKLVQTASLEGELSLIAGKNNAENDLKRKQINESLGFIEEKYSLESQKLSDETAIQIKGLQTQIEESVKKLNEVKPFSLAKLLNVDEAGLAAIGQAVQQVGALFSQLLQQQENAVAKEIEASQKKQDQYKSDISSLEDRLKTEQELNDQGATNNSDRIKGEIELKQQALEKEKIIEQQALQSRREIQTQQLLLDSISQASNLFTAATQIYVGLTKIDPTGIAATVAVSAMIAAFVLSKGLALKAIQDGNGFAKGGYTGDGGKYEEAGTVHKGEFVTTKEKTSRHRDLLEALHEGNTKDYRSALLKELIGTGVVIDRELPQKLNSQKSQINYFEKNNQLINLSTLEKRIDSTNEKLDKLIEAGNTKIYMDQNGNLVTQKGNNKSVIRKSK